MLPRLLPQILLLIALLFAQLGGLTHGLSHLPNENKDSAQAQISLHCDLCDEYAQIGNALNAHTPNLPSPILDETPHLNIALVPIRTRFVAFAARAPPTQSLEQLTC